MTDLTMIKQFLTQTGVEFDELVFESDHEIIGGPGTVLWRSLRVGDKRVNQFWGFDAEGTLVGVETI